MPGFRSVKRSRTAAYLLVSATLCLALGAPATAPRAQAPGPAPAAARELLNSERIEQKFGSYGIVVLRSDARLRVANLYSEAPAADGEAKPRTCRTFAVTRYPDEVAAAFAAEHGQILAGGSIGAVFAAHGWRVTKAHLYYGETEATPRVAELMRVAPGTRLALDAYVLEIGKGDARFEYASIVEIHHPDYLALPDLAALYGPADDHGRERLLASLLADAGAAAAR